MVIKQMTTREEVLKCDDLGRFPIDVPEWGGSFNVRQMTAKERLEFSREKQDDDEAGARLVVRLLTNGDGKTLFLPEDVLALMDKNANVITRIVNAILEFNALGRQSVEDAKKNYDPSPSLDSLSS